MATTQVGSDFRRRRGGRSLHGGLRGKLRRRRRSFGVGGLPLAAEWEGTNLGRDRVAPNDDVIRMNGEDLALPFTIDGGDDVAPVWDVR